MIIRALLVSLLITALIGKEAICLPEDRDSADSSSPAISVSLLPIAMYDSDIGFGAGAKTVLINKQKRRSFDLTIFGSSKGEQWYVFAFSEPDYDFRQNSKFTLAFDFKLEFDKLIKSNFFGIGNNTANNDFQFPRESFKIESSLSHSFTRRARGSLEYRVTHYSVYHYDKNWDTISKRIPGGSENNVFSAGLALQYDTRDSWINPRNGVKINMNLDQSLKMLGFDWQFQKLRFELSGYHVILGQDDLIAMRWWMQEIIGNAPYQELSQVGDGWTARGFKAGRFLDKAMALTSIEYRFPIYKKLGGVIFSDAGRVWRSLTNFGLSQWHTDYGTGLRFYLTNFVTRLDIGRSIEGNRIFFNFGHVF